MLHVPVTTLIATTIPDKRGYVVSYGQQQIPIYATGPSKAKARGIAYFKVAPDNEHLVSALLAQQVNRDNQQFLNYVEHYYAGH